MNDQLIPRVASAPDPVIDKLPPIFRIQSITRLPGEAGHVINRAVLFHERASLSVEWSTRQGDVSLRAGSLVSVCWLGRPECLNGAVRISRLARLERAEPALNLFETVPASWVIDRDLLTRASALWHLLSLPFRHLFNAIFWDEQRLYRYLTGPSSLSGHHAERCGNLRHTVEVGEIALEMALREPRVHPGVLLMAALVHDAGKADEYRLGAQALELTDRGKLVGHRFTVLEWIAVARALHRVKLAEAHYIALIHALTCAAGAPAWLGLREPQSMEAVLLSSADRLSGQSDLHRRNAPARSGFGRYHPHLRGRPYRLAETG